MHTAQEARHQQKVFELGRTARVSVAGWEGCQEEQQQQQTQLLKMRPCVVYVCVTVTRT